MEGLARPSIAAFGGDPQREERAGGERAVGQLANPVEADVEVLTAAACHGQPAFVTDLGRRNEGARERRITGRTRHESGGSRIEGAGGGVTAGVGHASELRGRPLEPVEDHLVGDPNRLHLDRVELAGVDPGHFGLAPVRSHGWSLLDRSGENPTPELWTPVRGQDREEVTVVVGAPHRVPATGPLQRGPG